MSSEAIFIQVGALAEGFAPHSNTLEPQHGLSGTTLALRFADGETLSCHFVDQQTLSWGEYRGIAYRATSIRPGILFIDFLDPGQDNASITLVCDRNQGNFTAVFGQLPDEQQTRLDAFSRVEQGLPLTAVNAEFRFGTLDDATVAPPHFTDELIGMRNMYTYSPTERYEHIYLNDNFYAWQCLDGVEKGLADVDRLARENRADAGRGDDRSAGHAHRRQDPRLSGQRFQRAEQFCRGSPYAGAEHHSSSTGIGR
jgi:hypothetical protein